MSEQVEINENLKKYLQEFGYRKDTKKAIVTLSEGNTIDSSLEIK